MNQLQLWPQQPAVQDDPLTAGFELEDVCVIWKNSRRSGIPGLPQEYPFVEIRAEVEQEATPPASGAAIMAFSGGLDSAFTAWRHRTGQAGRQ